MNARWLADQLAAQLRFLKFAVSQRSSTCTTIINCWPLTGTLTRDLCRDSARAAGQPENHANRPQLLAFE